MTARAVILATSALLVVTLARAEAPLSRANPASTNCVNHGGTLLMETDGSGGQYGVCRFADDRQCEEWALLRGECPPGGIRVTGYVTPAARYCALRGAHYQVLAGSNTPNEQGSCQFAGGRTCAADAFFSGLCTPDGADGIVQARFHCQGDRTIDAVFSNGSQSSVSLALSDGRSISLPQAESGSGARYANAGDRVVFWNKGNTAFVEEDGKATYQDCVTSGNLQVH